MPPFRTGRGPFCREGSTSDLHTHKLIRVTCSSAGGLIPTTKTKNEQNAKVWWTHQFFCIYQLKKKMLIPNRNIRIMNFGFAGRNESAPPRMSSCPLSIELPPSRPLDAERPKRHPNTTKYAKKHSSPFSAKQICCYQTLPRNRSKHYLEIGQLQDAHSGMQ